jgi:hypothetical protein
MIFINIINTTKTLMILPKKIRRGGAASTINHHPSNNKPLFLISVNLKGIPDREFPTGNSQLGIPSWEFPTGNSQLGIRKW